LVHSSWVRSVNGSGFSRKIRSPVLKNRFTFITLPHSSLNTVQRSIASLAHVTHSSLQMPRSPYELLTPRVSPPDVARELPGPYASTSVTLTPVEAR
jgi:hypothetical protein